MANRLKPKNTVKNFKNGIRLRRSYLVAGIVSLIAGLLIIGFAFLPIVNQPQCEGPIHSGCIIGANIGLGLIISLGLLVIALALLGIFLILLFSFMDARMKYPQRAKLIVKLVIIAAAVLFGWYSLVNTPQEAAEPVDDYGFHE